MLAVTLEPTRKKQRHELARGEWSASHIYRVPSVLLLAAKATNAMNTQACKCHENTLTHLPGVKDEFQPGERSAMAQLGER